MGVEGSRAADGIRTHDNNVGNVVLYQLSYSRMKSEEIDRHPKRFRSEVKTCSEPDLFLSGAEFIVAMVIDARADRERF